MIYVILVVRVGRLLRTGGARDRPLYSDWCYRGPIGDEMTCNGPESGHLCDCGVPFEPCHMRLVMFAHVFLLRKPTKKGRQKRW